MNAPFFVPTRTRTLLIVSSRGYPTQTIPNPNHLATLHFMAKTPPSFPGPQYQSLPPPDDLAVFFRETKMVSRLGWRVANQLEDFRPVLGGRGGGFKIPVQIRLLERLQFGEHDPQSRSEEHTSELQSL